MSSVAPSTEYAPRREVLRARAHVRGDLDAGDVPPPSPRLGEEEASGASDIEQAGWRLISVHPPQPAGGEPAMAGLGSKVVAVPHVGIAKIGGVVVEPGKLRDRRQRIDPPEPALTARDDAVTPRV